ncbi:MAG: nucleoid-associated protein EbfC [Bacillota bacterium]|nr:nucleoid-associated protein EbfC [Bacillota bacterium]MDK2856635.1 nucleoid-associated protein EbfC [Bacillota bacterium]MDK2925650.1 nucleoid-associated protein EbfC [Bacillota bacterium]
MGMGNMNKLLKQAQKLQAEMARVQEEMAATTVEATAGGGAVTVTVNGRPEVVAVKIDPAAVDPEDLEMLQDLIVAATNEALRKAQEMVAQAMARFTGGLGLPGF